jgi:hypothetical protein
MEATAASFTLVVNLLMSVTWSLISLSFVRATVAESTPDAFDRTQCRCMALG